ncbi:MAG: hypothetical protein HY659_15860, partial [Rhizobiales bacterium]|nr:hypothetical protein [Hyphomicrobiales bacterium]
MAARNNPHGKIILDPIFHHTCDPRLAASVTLASVLFVLISGAMLALNPPLKAYSQRSHAIADAPGAAPAKSVRVVGTEPRAQVPCEQQTWPHIDQRCLSSTSAKPVPPAADRAKDDAKLSPLTATGSAVVPAGGAQGATAASPPRAGSSTPVAPRDRDSTNTATVTPRNATTAPPRNDDGKQSALRNDAEANVIEGRAPPRAMVDDDDDD